MLGLLIYEWFQYFFYYIGIAVWGYRRVIGQNELVKSPRPLAITVQIDI